jgi:hypothetical protein
MLSTQARSASLTWKSRQRRHAELLLIDRRPDGFGDARIALLEDAVAIVRQEGVEIDDRGDRRTYLLQGARNRVAGVGVATQDDIGQPLPFDDVDDVGNVGRQLDLLVEQVRALAESGQCRREHLVAQLLEPVAHAAPAPPAVP